MNTAQFKNGLAWVSQKATAGYEGCHWMLSAGSTYMIYSVIINNGMASGFSIYLLMPIALAAGAVWYNAIEHTLKVILPFAVAYICTPKDEKAKMEKQDRRSGRLAVFASTALLIATGSLSFFINPHISDSLNEVEDSSAEIAQSQSVQSSYDKDVDILREELAAAKVADKEAVAEAKAKRAALILAAEKSKGAKMYRLYKSKEDEWAKGQLRAAIAKAKKKGDEIVASAEKSLTAPSLQSGLTSYIATSGAARDTVAMATASIINGREMAYKKKVGNMNLTLFWGVAFTLCLFVFLCFLMVSARLSRGEDVVDDDSPGLTTVIKAGLSTFNKRQAEKLADKWKVKYVGKLPALALAKTSSPVTHPPGTVTVPPPVTPPVTPVTKPVTPAPTIPTVTVPPPAGTVVGRGVTGVTPPAASVTTPEEIERLKTYARVNYDRIHIAATESGKANARTNFENAKAILTDAGYTFSFGPDKRKKTVKRVGKKPKTITYVALHLS